MKFEILKAEIEELESILKQIRQESNRKFITSQLNTLKSELLILEPPVCILQAEHIIQKDSKPIIYETIKNYSWDQENTYVVWFFKKYKHQINKYKRS